MEECNELPYLLVNLFKNVEVENDKDAIVFAMHMLMLDVGFITKDDIPETEFKLLLNKWHCGEVYKIEYTHPSCLETTGLMTCIPLGNTLCVFGMVNGISISSANKSFHVNDFVKSTDSSDASKVFFNVKTLSREFKDLIAYRLLAAMQDAEGLDPTFGISTATDNIKLEIMNYLPVKSVLAMSQVNQELHELCKVNSLWKTLCRRDFKLSPEQKMKADGNWKEMYKKKHLKMMKTTPLINSRTRIYDSPDSQNDFSFMPEMLDDSMGLDPLFHCLMSGIDQAVARRFPNLADRRRCHYRIFKQIKDAPVHRLNFPFI